MTSTATFENMTEAAPATKSVSTVSAAPVSTVVITGDVFAVLKGALPVDYNTLAQIKCTNGNFVERETALVLGDTVVFELLSYQDSYVISTGDDKAPKELLAFSNDGVLTKDGISVVDVLNDFRSQGYARANMKQRLVVVGAIKQASKTSNFNDVPVQFDLSPETRVLFQRYQALTSYGIRVGKLDAAKVLKIKGICRLVTKGTNTYTVADFSAAE